MIKTVGLRGRFYEVRDHALYLVTPSEIPEEENLETLGESGFSLGGAGGGGVGD